MLLKPNEGYLIPNYPKITYNSFSITPIITHWEKLLDSDCLRNCEFIRNLRANSVIRGKLHISRVKSVIFSECKYKKN